MRRAAGVGRGEEDEQIVRGNVAGQVQQLVTADGTYATQSAFVMPAAGGGGGGKAEAESRPTLRG